MSGRKTNARLRAEDRILGIASRGGRSSRQTNTVPNVYRELLTEASDPSRVEEPARKRRRVGGGTRAQPVSVDSDSEVTRVNPDQQTIVDSGDSDDEDLDWEDVDAGEQRADRDVDDLGDVSVEVGGHPSTPKRSTRKPLTAAERALAIAVHKSHVLCLLFHGHIRNSWCNIRSVESKMRTILSAKIIGQLNPDPKWVQLRQSESFLEGLKLASELWQAKFKITKAGLRRAIWISDHDGVQASLKKLSEDTETIAKSDFSKAAQKLQGSQDLGNQLFCALLRAVGVETRLVFSLQPLPWSTANQKLNTPHKEKTVKPRIYATFEHEQDSASSADESAPHGNGESGPKGVDIFSNPRRRLGQASAPHMPVGNYQRASASPPRKQVRKLDYPVFWVEALNPAYQKWVAVDPLVTGTINRPIKLEPPASYEGNSMSYVIAFEEDSVAKDVTRRYARSFNAKTRKLRVETTPDGKKWFSAAMKAFKRANVTDRDQIEEAELTAKEAQEGMPNNIQDFKDHPQYALERHLKRNEVIWPKRQVGKASTGKAASSKLEPVYRRIDVQKVQSADRWYRLGREIKPGEQPVKHVPARTRRRQISVESTGDESDTTALYMYSQTELYVPPPVIRGKVPRNAYGNLDVYVPTMVPEGGAHISHTQAKKAAQLLGIDFAEAVTGFQFKGRQGTAIVQGVVVASQYKESVESVIQGFQEEVERDENHIQSMESLRLWRRFLLGLQIAHRIGLSEIHAADKEASEKFRQELQEAEDEQEEVIEAGGFFPDSGADQVIRPTAHLFNRPSSPPAPQSVHVQRPNQPARRGKRRLVVDDPDDEEMTYEPEGLSTTANTEVADKDMAEVDDQTTNAQAWTTSMKSVKPRETDQVTAHRQDYAGDMAGGFLAEDVDDAPAHIQEAVLGEDDEAAELHHDPKPHDNSPGIRSESPVVHPEMNGIETSKGGVDGTELAKAAKEAELDSGGGYVVDEPQINTGPHGKTVAGTASPSSEDAEDAFAEAREVDRQLSDQDEKGSLLSHDPEDDDADPEWL